MGDFRLGLAGACPPGLEGVCPLDPVAAYQPDRAVASPPAQEAACRLDLVVDYRLDPGVDFPLAQVADCLPGPVEACPPQRVTLPIVHHGSCLLRNCERGEWIDTLT